MTWQRIDENTYIDDTLVTCAEYQLFIDEMRQQGKHYQPDHWKSYWFPVGKAQVPILGIRYSDAISFCKWLTQREGGNWCYSLPYLGSDKDFPLTGNNHLLYSYWIMSTESQVSKAQADPAKIVENNLVEYGSAREIDTDINYLREKILTHIRLFYPDCESLINRTLDNIQSFIRTKIQDDIKNNFLRQAEMIDQSLGPLDAAQTKSESYLISPKLSKLRRAWAVELDVSPLPDIEGSRTLASIYTSNPDLAGDIDMLIDKIVSREALVVEVFPLKGVRLVKERIK